MWDHPKISEYKELSDNIKDIAGKVADNWDKARLYAGEIKMSLQDVERMQGGEIELSEDAKKIEQYRDIKSQTKEMWQEILSTKSNLTPSQHEQYKEFADMVQKRDELAYELVSFGSHKEIHDKDGNLVKANNYNHLDKSEWKTILSHSDLHMEKQVKTDSHGQEMQRQKDIEYIKQYELLDKGEKKALSSVQAKAQKDSLKASESYIEKNKQVVSDILKLDPSIDKTSLVADLSKNSQSKIQAILHLRTVRDESIRENIGKVIDEFAKNKQLANSIDKLIPVVKDEQKYLSAISGNLQDKNINSYGKDIVPIVKAARSAARSSDSLNKMVSLIENHNGSKHFTEEKLVSDLRKDNNIQEAIKQINSDITKNHIYGTLKDYKDSIKMSTDPGKIVGIIKERSEFLARQDVSNIRHDRDYHHLNKEIRKHASYDEKVFNDLNKIVQHSLQQATISKKDTIKSLKSNTNPLALTKSLVKSYQHTIISNMNKELDYINKGGEIVHRGKSHDNPVSYIKHVMHSYKDKEYFPMKRVERGLKRIEKEIKQQQIQQQQSMVKEFGGMTR